MKEGALVNCPLTGSLLLIHCFSILLRKLFLFKKFENIFFVQMRPTLPAGVTVTPTGVTVTPAGPSGVKLGPSAVKIISNVTIPSIQVKNIYILFRCFINNMHSSIIIENFLM